MTELIFKISQNLITVIETRVIRTAEVAPQVLGATAIFLFGWILAEVSYRAIIALGHKIHIETLSEKVGLTHFLKQHEFKSTPTDIVAKGLKGYLIFLFFIESTKVAGLTEVSEFLSQLMAYVPDVVISIFIMLVGIRMGHTLQMIIKTSLSFAKDGTADALGMAAKYTLVTFSVLAALSQLQIAEILINTLFIGFVSMLTIAGGLSFGLGGKDLVHELLKDIKKVELKSKK